MKKGIFLLVLSLCFLAASLIVGCKSGKPMKVRIGADVLIQDNMDLIKGKTVGLVINNASLLSDGRPLIDALLEEGTIKIGALFAPEHGVRGDTTSAVEDAIDEKTGIPIFSLYGKTYKPSPEMLKGIDVLIYDLQDVGAKFYTYTATLGFVMEAASENSVPVIVLDRPAPIRTNYIDGPVTDTTMRSFVGYAKVPIAYGMTIGELAQMYNGESWLQNGLKADLSVIKMAGWKRGLWHDQTGLSWIKPSPNMPFLSTATVYTGTCLFEGTNVSEGRGTDKPFELIGAPWLDAETVASELNRLGLPGVEFEPAHFTPTLKPGNTHLPKYNEEPCNGIFVKVTDRDTFEPVKAGIYLLWAIKKTHPIAFEWKMGTIDRLSGTTNVRNMLDEGKTPAEIFRTWQNDLEVFRSLQSKYLIYK